MLLLKNKNKQTKIQTKTNLKKKANIGLYLTTETPRFVKQLCKAA